MTWYYRYGIDVFHRPWPIISYRVCERVFQQIEEGAALAAPFISPALEPVGSNPSPDKPVRAINTTQAAGRIRPLTPTINTKKGEVFFLGDSTATRPERGGGGGKRRDCRGVGTSASPLGTEARGGQGQESRRPAARLLPLLAPSGTPACPLKAQKPRLAP